MFRRAWKRKAFLLVFILLVPLAPARTDAGVEHLSYDDVVGEALQYTSRLKVKKEEILINEASYRQSLSNLYPSLALNGRLERFNNLTTSDSIGTINGQVIGGVQDEWRSSVYLLGEYTLSNWYKKRYESYYYEKLTEASIFDRESEKKKIILEVTDIYGSLTEGSIRLGYLGRMIEKMKESVALRAAAQREGEISYEDLLRAEVQVVDLEKENAEVLRQFNENLTRLTLFTGIEYGEDVKPRRLTVGADVSLRFDSERVEQTPEYQSKKKEVEAYQQRGRAAQNNMLPDVGIYGRYDFYGRNADVYDALKDTDKNSWNAGVYISFPLFDGGQRKWERERSYREIRRQEESLRVMKEEKRKDSAGLFAKLQDLDRTIAQYRKLLQRYEKLVGIASGATALGGRSRAELLESEKEAIAIERDMEVFVNQRAVAVKKYLLETDFASSMGYVDGNGTDRN